MNDNFIFSFNVTSEKDTPEKETEGDICQEQENLPKKSFKKRGISTKNKKQSKKSKINPKNNSGEVEAKNLKGKDKVKDSDQLKHPGAASSDIIDLTQETESVIDDLFSMDQKDIQNIISSFCLNLPDDYKKMLIKKVRNKS